VEGLFLAQTHTVKSVLQKIEVNMNDTNKTIQDRKPNFRTKDGKLFLVRCFACDDKIGTENYTSDVSSGVCAWCGWKEEETCTYKAYTKCKEKFPEDRKITLDSFCRSKVL